MRPLAGPDLSGQVKINSHLREINRLPIQHTVSGTGACGYPRRTELSHGNLPSTDAQAEPEMGPACPRVRPHERTHGAYAGFRTGTCAAVREPERDYPGAGRRNRPQPAVLPAECTDDRAGLEPRHA